MKADYVTNNKLKTIILDVDVAELVILITGIEDQLKKQKDYLQFYKEELINPIVECNANAEIQKCKTKIEKLEGMLLKIQS